MKFWVTVIVDDRYGISYPSTDHWKYLTATTPSFSSYVDNLTDDPQYLRIDGKPVIGLFSSGGSGPAMSLAQWDAFLAPMGGRSGVFAIQMSCSDADATTFSANAKFCYGVQNVLPSTGQNAWTSLQTLDQAKWASSLTGGFVRIAQINAVQDPRALDTSLVAGTRFSDQPTEPQWFSHVIAGLSVNNARTAIIFWNELAEEGPGVIPTVGESTRYLDAIKWARIGPVPTTYTYELNLHSLYVTGTGFTTYQSPFSGNAGGAHENDEIESATTGHIRTVSHPSMTGCGLYARTGPDEGIVKAVVDGIDTADVDLYSASLTHHVNVWNSSALSDATHTCGWRVTGTKNASSSGVKAVLDSAKITYNPSG